MSSLEPEVKDFLKRIVSSLSLGLLWLMINMTLGIYFNGLIVGDRPSVFNFITYIFLGTSLGLYLRFLFRTWKKRFPHG